jgi:molybdopterin converting factor small subunit
MKYRVEFHSYFKDITETGESFFDMPEGATLGELIENVEIRFPKLREMKRSMLMAVGVEYERKEYVLKEGDEVSLFPPVQGG